MVGTSHHDGTEFKSRTNNTDEGRRVEGKSGSGCGGYQAHHTLCRRIIENRKRGEWYPEEKVKEVVEPSLAADMEEQSGGPPNWWNRRNEDQEKPNQPEKI